MKIKIGDIVKAKFGSVVFGVTKKDGKRENISFDILGIVTDIFSNEQSKETEIEVRFFFDSTSSQNYKPFDLEVLFSTDLIKAIRKITPEQIRKDFFEDDINMTEFLASTPADGLTLEEAFELYIGARKWADDDRFFVDSDSDELIELGEN